MRLWSLHPSHLDRQGLVACWREALLAQKVLAGKTTGYRNHPQLTRFRQQPDPMASIGCFLVGIQAEATARGYNFDASKIVVQGAAGVPQIPVTSGQLDYEWEHLGKKIAARSPEFPRAPHPTPHPLFHVVLGGVADWEVTG
ncbi:pyrimidine dimer DNA glycosylase/endonuclease V [Corynebacterium glucuronolyticum]|uniref:pyrimidine dimer DNA glycosylase/endonuclease V n=1 Tax=Corynebacterium glucuronolyticum TaxID=39791 RepID=UPI00223BDAE7|nr:pyrimidine dimer DNA glycosylase/endonuclease V [Corynebacterium glucuronolyticum]MCT1443442.1 pyrimidine dimer DNA glycosylase/endonuclease V [Corynebacterium glucuronolyticum]